MIKSYLVLFFFFLTLSLQTVDAQDTLKISYPEFISKALEISPVIQAEKQKEYRALSKLSEVKSNRYVPRFDISSNHGVMPGVISPSGLPKDEWYLEPNLENDWNNWKIFTKIDFTVAQPIFTWGGLSSAIDAVKLGAEAVAYQNDRNEDAQRLIYSKLYFSAVLVYKLDVLANEAMETFKKAEKQLKELDEDGEIEAKELYKFDIYKQQFFIKADEIKQNKAFVNEAMNIALGTRDFIYKPTSDSLTDSIADQSLVFFQSEALQLRPEMKAIQAADKAASYAIKTQKAQRLPALFFGLSGEYVHTPRPVQNQPLFGTRFDYVNLIYTFGIRQSLNFGILNAKVAQTEYQQKEIEYSQTALKYGILVEVTDAWKDFKIAESKKEKLGKALQTSKEWLRKEQIDYDLGFGEVMNLVDALKTNLELEAEFRQSESDYNVKKAILLSKSGKLK